MNNPTITALFIEQETCYDYKRIFAVAGTGPWTLAEILRMEHVSYEDRCFVEYRVYVRGFSSESRIGEIILPCADNPPSQCLHHCPLREKCDAQCNAHLLTCADELEGVS